MWHFGFGGLWHILGAFLQTSPERKGEKRGEERGGERVRGRGKERSVWGDLKEGERGRGRKGMDTKSSTINTCLPVGFPSTTLTSLLSPSLIFEQTITSYFEKKTPNLFRAPVRWLWLVVLVLKREEKERKGKKEKPASGKAMAISSPECLF